MDVLNVVKTGENYRLLYDEKGRFTLVSIKGAEANFKLCKIVKKAVGPNKIPYIVTHDARTIRFPHPDINEGDTIKYDLENNKIVSWISNEPGHLAYVTGGNNIGRVGTILHVERHLGSFDIVHLKDSNGKTFATRSGNIFIIGNKKSEITLPANEGLYYGILEEKAQKENKGRKASSKAQ
jgi:small subunit ribosomal protein S4e